VSRVRPRVGPADRVSFTVLLLGLLALLGIGAADAAPLGAITEFGTPGANPAQVVAGPDGNLWFSDRNGAVGRITPDGTVNRFTSGLNPGSAVRSSNSSWRPRRQPWPAPGGRCSDFRFSSLCVNRVGVRGDATGCAPPNQPGAGGERGSFGPRASGWIWLLAAGHATAPEEMAARDVLGRMFDRLWRVDSAARSVEGGCFVVRGR